MDVEPNHVNGGMVEGEKIQRENLKPLGGLVYLERERAKNVKHKNTRD